MRDLAGGHLLGLLAGLRLLRRLGGCPARLAVLLLPEDDADDGELAARLPGVLSLWPPLGSTCDLDGRLGGRGRRRGLRRA